MPGWRKGCCFAGQSSFPQQMAAVPEGLTAGDSSNRIVRRSSTAVQKHQPECALRDDRRELGIIFRNSGFCKAICFMPFRISPERQSECLYVTFVSCAAAFIKGGEAAFSVTIFTGSHDFEFNFVSRRFGAGCGPGVAGHQASTASVEAHAAAPRLANPAIPGQN